MLRQSLLVMPWGMCVTLGVLVASAQAQNATCVNNGAGSFVNSHGDFIVNGGQINLGGATLLVDFFTTPASTNDWNDVDGDGFAGFDPVTFPFVDQLATQFIPGSALTTWWMFQYRSVGSVKGFNEFVDNQTCFVIPKTVPSERGIFNGVQYADTGVVTWAGPIANSSGTPFEPCEIEGAFLDVPGSYAVQVPGVAQWNRTPTAPGYGLNPILSSTGAVSMLQPLSRDCGECSVSLDGCIDDADCPIGETCVSLGITRSLNTLATTPDVDTVFDVVAAWTPVSLIANRGTNIENIRYTESQYLWVTGRMPNGENLTAVTRDVGSGTRNAAMNSLGVDTSWGRGDNIGARVDDKFFTSLGPNTQPTNCGGSSILEHAVENHRLGIGYTGLAGGSRSAVDAQSGKYEILNTCKDVAATGQPACDCSVTGFVRPGLDTVLDNCDTCTGYQIAGQGSFAFRGNPNANRDPFDPKFENSQPLDNQAVADYVNNILDSIDAFAGNVQAGECNVSRICSVTTTTACAVAADCPVGETCDLKPCVNDSNCPTAGDFCKSKLNSPGQLLATQFFLPAGLDCMNVLSEPLKYVPTSTNQTLQDFIRTQSVVSVPAYGSRSVAGRVPLRNSLPVPDQYSDGSGSGEYRYWNGASYSTIIAGNSLSERNAVQGDFNNDLARDVNDATELVSAYFTPRAWQQTSVANGMGDTGGMTDDNAIPEVLGDFNGDGSLTKEDLRYFADGLAMVPSVVVGEQRLDRKVGHIAIDTAIAALGEPFPWADTRDQLVVPPAIQGDDPTFEMPSDVNDTVLPFLTTGKPYAAGDFRGDVAGALPTAGAPPMGWDGVVNAADIDYVCANIADWSNLDEAVFMDLSCDMDGDTAVTLADVTELVVEILGTHLGDFNLDGLVDATDQTIVNDTISLGAAGCNGSQNCGWGDGDVNCDGIVDANDMPVLSAQSIVGPKTNRYLRFTLPTAANGPAAAEVIRVRIVTYQGLGVPSASTYYAGLPFQAPEETVVSPGLTFTASPLSCGPVSHPWSSEGEVAVYGAEIVPGSEYTVQRSLASCPGLTVNESCWSAPLTIVTAKYGDVAGDFDPAPLQPDFNDISAFIAKFLGSDGAPIKATAQLQPNIVNPLHPIDFKDISAVVQAFLGISFADAVTTTGSCVCPSAVTCGATNCTTDNMCGGGFCINGSCTDACGRCTP